MTTITSTSSAVQAPFEHAGFDEAQLAAAAFLARATAAARSSTVASTSLCHFPYLLSGPSSAVGA
jgi:hypothetical protein